MNYFCGDVHHTLVSVKHVVTWMWFLCLDDFQGALPGIEASSTMRLHVLRTWQLIWPHSFVKLDVQLLLDVYRLCSDHSVAQRGALSELGNPVIYPCVSTACSGRWCAPLPRPSLVFSQLQFLSLELLPYLDPTCFPSSDHPFSCLLHNDSSPCFQVLI